MKAGDLIYIPAQITLMEFDSKVATNINPLETYVGPSPIRYHNLEKPMNLLLLEDYEDISGDWVPVLYEGEKMYINKHDVLPYQEEKWLG